MNIRARVRFSSVSHVGCVRKVNEDSILSLPSESIWVVSDGMGGHAAGDFASQTVVECVAMMPPGLEPYEKMMSLREAIHRAHSMIRAEAGRRHVDTIGATVVALILTEAHFLAFWAGDSRLYRLREGEIEILTTDHSIVAELVLAGELTWDQADHHPDSNAITRAVGVGDELELDKIRGETRSGDRFLLCSDGLNKYATMGVLQQVLQDTPIELVADRLLQIALGSGGGDNVSIIVVDIL